MTEIMPFPENNSILFYWTAPQDVLFCCLFLKNTGQRLGKYLFYVFRQVKTGKIGR